MDNQLNVQRACTKFCQAIWDNRTMVFRFSGTANQLIEEQDIISKGKELTSGEIKRLEQIKHG